MKKAAATVSAMRRAAASETLLVDTVALCKWNCR
jgi:hypothetical protein